MLENKKLPKDWKLVELKDVTSILGDGLHGTPKYTNESEYFFINGNNLGEGKITIKENTKKVSVEEYEKYKKNLNDKTVLVSINGTLGNVAFYNNEKVILGKSACYFNVLDSLDKKYIKLLLSGLEFLNYAHKSATGSTIPNVSLKTMREFKFPLPPLETQHAIVSKIEELFSELDKGIEDLKTAQQQLKIYRQSVLKWAFEGKLTSKNLKERELPKGWEIVMISDIANVLTGTTPSKSNSDYYGNEYPFYKPTDLEAGNNVFKSKDGLTELGLKQARYVPEFSTLVTCIGATIGKTGYIRNGGGFNQQINAIVPKKGINPLFLYYQSLGKDFNKQIIANASATTLPIINKSKFQALKMSICNLQEQDKIVQEIEIRLSVADKMKESISKSLQQAEALRQSILKKAFSGELV